jgi:hypothetical protein
MSSGLIDNPMSVPTHQVQGISPVNISITATQYAVPVSGALVVIKTSQVIINPAGSLAALTIEFPSAPADGQSVTIISSAAVSSVTASNVSFTGGSFTALVANTPVKYIFSASTATWWKN